MTRAHLRAARMRGHQIRLTTGLEDLAVDTKPTVPLDLLKSRTIGHEIEHAFCGIRKRKAKDKHASSAPSSPPTSRHGCSTAELSICRDQRRAPPAASTLSSALWSSNSRRKCRLPRPGPSECHATSQTCRAVVSCTPTTPPLRAVLDRFLNLGVIKNLLQ